MSKFLAIKKKFESGQIKKSEFIKLMGELHTLLFDYQNLLNSSVAKKIEISEAGIIVTLNSGIKLHCIVGDNRVVPIEILNFGNYEELLWDKFSKILNKPKTIFDVGANIGYFSLYMAKKFRGAKFYAFEPIFQTCEYLNKNIKLNKRLCNIGAYNLGLSNEKRAMEMFYNTKGCGGSSLKNISEESCVRKITCEFSTIDDFVRENKIKGLDVIKCDVEGAEKLVYEGGINTIKKFKPIIFSEMLRKWCAKFSYHPNDIIKLFRELGYKCFTMSEDSLTEVFEVTEETVETNFIFMPK